LRQKIKGKPQKGQAIVNIGSPDTKSSADLTASYGLKKHHDDSNHNQSVD